MNKNDIDSGSLKSDGTESWRNLVKKNLFKEYRLSKRFHDVFYCSVLGFISWLPFSLARDCFFFTPTGSHNRDAMDYLFMKLGLVVSILLLVMFFRLKEKVAFILALLVHVALRELL